MVPRWTSSIALGVLLVATTIARGDDRVSDPDDETHLEMAVFEATVALSIPAGSYWATKEHQAVDFDIGTDWASWRTKLFSLDWVKFDTNPFHVNAIRHPLAGAVDYQIMRANGYSTNVATAFAVVKGAFWEYFIEFREDPSINDMIFNGIGGIAIGEPMYQLGQLWRGSRVTLADRARTALLSPFDAVHDIYRAPRRWHRPSAWRAIELSIGGVERGADGHVSSELAASADLDIVSNPAYARGGDHDGAIRTGEWSRLRIAGRIGQIDDRAALTGTLFRTQTVWIGRYHQTAGGDGRLLSLGSAFTYRNDWLGTDKDRIAIGHLLGAQLQLSRRRAGYELRWDAAAYVDFGLAQALVFARQARFPEPPPYYSALQAEGYIDAFGASATTRLRTARGPWHVDLELDGHALRQISSFDRREGTSSGSLTTGLSTAGVQLPSATGVDEQRAYARLELAYQPDEWGAAVVGEGGLRRSSWRDEVRYVDDLSIGAMFQLTY